MTSITMSISLFTAKTAYNSSFDTIYKIDKLTPVGATMYLRFVTLTPDEESRKKQGLFFSVQRLLDDGEFDRYEIEAVKQILNWFNDKMKVPPLLKRDGNNRCIAWFKPEAEQAIKLMWEMYYLLQAKGIPVEVLKDDDVGEIHYEDDWQVIAQPYRHNRKRHY